jgi:hypothetical protein
VYRGPLPVRPLPVRPLPVRPLPVRPLPVRPLAASHIGAVETDIVCRLGGKQVRTGPGALRRKMRRHGDCAVAVSDRLPRKGVPTIGVLFIPSSQTFDAAVSSILFVMRRSALKDPCKHSHSPDHSDMRERAFPGSASLISVL